MPRKTSVYTIARARSGFAPRPGSPRTTASPSASTSTSASETIISLMFTWKPAHTSGSASRKSCGLKNFWRTSCMRYFRVGTFEKSIANHFFCSFEIVPLSQRPLIAVFTAGVSFEPFWSTAPYCSFVTI